MDGLLFWRMEARPGNRWAQSASASALTNRWSTIGAPPGRVSDAYLSFVKLNRMAPLGS